MIEVNWEKNEIRSFKRVNEFLEKYRYSSYLDYIGKKNFPLVTQKVFINQCFKDHKNVNILFKNECL